MTKSRGMKTAAWMIGWTLIMGTSIHSGFDALTPQFWLFAAGAIIIFFFAHD